MCGIAGILKICDAMFNSGDVCNRMLKRIKHRGPDSTNVVEDLMFAMGTNRLRTQGTLVNRQPYQYDGVTLVVNGDIFNAREILQEAVLPIGELNNDSDALFEGYRNFGDRVFDVIRGQFSTCIHDSTARKLLLVRDHFSIHPLYFLCTDKAIAFASECKAFLEVPNLRMQLNMRALMETALFYGPALESSCFQDVHSVEPGQIVSISYNGGRLSIEKRQLAAPRIATRLGSNELVDALHESVNIRLTGDSPACCLSGGVDSSLISELAWREDHRTEFFTVRFDDPAFDEGEKAMAALPFGAFDNWHYTFVGNAQLSRAWKSCVWHSEMPLIRSAPIAMLYLSKLMKDRGHSWCLTGEGADELFRGYQVFDSGVPSISKRSILKEPLLRLFKRPHFESLSHHRYDLSFESNSWLKNSSLPYDQRIELETKLFRYLLTAQGDRISLANGVMFRYPYLDRRVFASSTIEVAECDKRKLRQAAISIIGEKANHPKQGYLAPRFRLDGESLLTENVFNQCGYFDFSVFQDLLEQWSHLISFDLFIASVHLLHFAFVDRDSTYQCVFSDLQQSPEFDRQR